jgi:hypothetical protein
VGYVTRVEGKPVGTVGKGTIRKNGLEMDHEIGREGLRWMYSVQDSDQWRVVNKILYSWVP